MALTITLKLSDMNEAQVVLALDNMIGGYRLDRETDKDMIYRWARIQFANLVETDKQRTVLQGPIRDPDIVTR